MIDDKVKEQKQKNNIYAKILKKKLIGIAQIDKLVVQFIKQEFKIRKLGININLYKREKSGQARRFHLCKHETAV